MSIDTEALAEVDLIINMMSKEDYEKIPNRLKEFINSKKSKEYIPNISKEIPLHKQNLRNNTKTLCSLIYRSYLCPKDKKEILEKEDKRILIENEQKLREKYNPDNIFKNEKTINQVNTDTLQKNECVELANYEKPKLYKRLFNKILKILKIIK